MTPDEETCPVCGGDLHGMSMHSTEGCVYELRRQLAERDKRIAGLAGRATAFDKAEVERLHCIMLVMVGEAALALGDDHALVARLRAIREQAGEANERAISIIEALLSKIPNGLQFSGTAEFIELPMNRPGMFIPLVTKEKP